MVTKLQGAIIAAGRGERLRISTHDDIPKPLVDLGGEAMLSRQARAMIDAGADSVVAVTTDGSTPAGTTTDQTETGSIVDATFTGLTAGATYYVTFTQGFGSFTATDTAYTGIIR